MDLGDEVWYTQDWVWYTLNGIMTVVHTLETRTCGVAAGGENKDGIDGNRRESSLPRCHRLRGRLMRPTSQMESRSSQSIRTHRLARDVYDIQGWTWRFSRRGEKTNYEKGPLSYSSASLFPWPSSSVSVFIMPESLVALETASKICLTSSP